MIRSAYPPLLVTALPASPVDGQEIYLDTQQGPIWHLRYSTDAGGWQSVGATPITEVVTGAASILGLFDGAPYDTLTGAAGPSITIPVTGDYQVTVGATVTLAGPGTFRLSYGLNDGDTPASDDDAAFLRASAAGGGGGSVVSAAQLKTGLRKGKAIKEKGRVNGPSSGTAQNRYLSVLPVLLG